MRAMLSLALPVVLSYLGIMSMALVDLLFVGRVSSAALGAVGLGSSIFSWAMIFGVGMLSALDYTVSTAFGAGRKKEIGAWMIQGLALSLLLSVPMTAVLWFAADLVSILGIHPDVARETGPYLKILAPSLFPVLAFAAIRMTLQATGKVAPSLWVLLGANILNVGLNAWLVPTMGSAGSAWGTTLARVAMLIAIALYSSRIAPFRRWLDWQRDKLRELWQIGLPAALQMTFEVGVFSVATALAARFTPSDLAAHQVVLNTASMTFMVPLGIGAATAVLVGQKLGEKKTHQAFANGWMGLWLGAGFMALSGILLSLLGNPIAKLYSDDPLVIQASAQLFIIAALFQLSDGVQSVLTGALRGLGETRSSALANLIGHWGVGLPLGTALAFWYGKGVFGLWVGLSIGLTVVAGILLARWMTLYRRAQA